MALHGIVTDPAHVRPDHGTTTELRQPLFGVLSSVWFQRVSSQIGNVARFSTLVQIIASFYRDGPRNSKSLAIFTTTVGRIFNAVSAPFARVFATATSASIQNQYSAILLVDASGDQLVDASGIPLIGQDSQFLAPASIISPRFSVSVSIV